MVDASGVSAWRRLPPPPSQRDALGRALYREAGWKRAHLVELTHGGTRAIFTDAEGNDETEHEVADLPGEWAPPVTP